MNTRSFLAPLISKKLTIKKFVMASAHRDNRCNVAGVSHTSLQNLLLTGTCNLLDLHAGSEFAMAMRQETG
jgi:hypothetical protein